MINWEKTKRGFMIGTFADTYGHKCELQESSLATEDCIWLGIADAEPKIMASDAKSFGIKTEQTTGWIPYPIPDEVLLRTRMHLNRERALELIKALQVFVDTGCPGDES